MSNTTRDAAPCSPTTSRKIKQPVSPPHPHLRDGQLPPPISALNSKPPQYWARNSVKQRLPEILERLNQTRPGLLDKNFVKQFSAAIVNNGPLAAVTTGPESATWTEAAIGQTWHTAGWFFVEAYFYRLILDHTNYFGKILVDADDPDPFAPQKRAALADALGTIEAIEAEFKHKVYSQKEATRDILELGLHINLWSNKADLSKNPQGCSVDKLLEELQAEKKNILLDDSEMLFDYIFNKMQPGGHQTVHFITDNAGLEIVTDLYLADMLLHFRLARSVVFHVKYHPTFVSDATTDDVWYAIQKLAEVPSLAPAAARFRQNIEQQSFIIQTDPYWNSYLPFWQMPDHIRDQLSKAALVISKGDANARRLHGDLMWPFETKTSSIVNYFPSNLLIIRTLKSETVSSVPKEVQSKLEAEDPSWYYDGRYGTLQFVPLQSNNLL